MLFDKELDENLKVCMKCDHHFVIGARERIHSLVETCTFEEMDADMISVDVLGFTGAASYKDKLASNWKKTNLKDAVSHRHRHDRQTSCCARRDGLQLPRRLNGVGRW
jgi:acetyl-CoA carboxylase carboxyl transferase subunit beta